MRKKITLWIMSVQTTNKPVDTKKYFFKKVINTNPHHQLVEFSPNHMSIKYALPLSISNLSTCSCL